MPSGASGRQRWTVERIIRSLISAPAKMSGNKPKGKSLNRLRCAPIGVLKDLGYAVFGLAVVLTLVVIEAQAGDLLPHRALYRMSLATTSSTSDITDARGAMLYSFTDVCDAWASETNVYLRLEYEGGGERETTWSFASWEAKNGKSYHFRIRHNRDGRTLEVLQGKVALPSPGSAGIAQFTSPEETEIELPSGTLFPTRHLLALLNETNQNGRLLRTVFDGASLENPYEISAIIGSKSGDQGSGENGDLVARTKTILAAGLERTPTRHIRMAFFPHQSHNALPEFELSVDYRGDGVAEHIRQDFGKFTLDLVPDNIEVLDRNPC
ncbi:MAG: hypothetical protein CFH05_01428 [Alphaproteobacteria bacterium MarineAlpha3_Bin4]|nr:MAG: hypothetical protein CFH05_01428 [Alphaproteobacteria bacterium MarineAlpha3_Bin4]